MRRTVVSLAFVLTWSGCTCASDVTIAPPRVPQGGRAVAIAVSPSNQKRIIVASETGGLFRTFDGGKSFQHLDGFPTYAPVDVAVASSDPNIVIATARDDFRTVSGGGIWRSTDGGGSWKRPAGWPPAMSCPLRSEARGISHMPLTKTFHVATDCGIAVSSDNGATFSMVVLNPLKPKVRDVLVLNRETGVAVDDSLIWFLNRGTWQQAAGGPDSTLEFAIHSLASPWWTGERIFYHVGRDREIYVSTDGGANWTFMQTPPHGGGREKFVRVGRGLDGDPTHFDVYFGDGFTMWRQAVTTVIPGGSNEWFEPKSMDHRDPSDVAFSPGYEEPIMLATDGGVHLTPDSGRTWKLTGSNYGGFTALQIGEMTGRAVEGDDPHLDLYYGTQDNDIKGSSDGGKTWDGSIAHEGAFLNADGANPERVDGPVTGRHCGGCRLFLATPHLGSTSSPPPFPNAPDGSPANRADAPAQLIGPVYIQSVRDAGPPVSTNYFLTNDRGTSWSPAFSIPFEPLGVPKFGGNLVDPVAYVGIKRSGNTIGLFRAQNVATQATVRRADSVGLNSVGILVTGQATYTVFGVNPSNPNVLLAPDVFWQGIMKGSSDGGLTWYPQNDLTVAITDSGTFNMKKGMQSFVTAIAWDPSNTCHILIGTMQNGVIRSADGGRTWKRVAGSTVATYITSFFFPPTGSIWMSTNGRGLWTIDVDRRPPGGPRCQFPRPTTNWPPVDTVFATTMAAQATRPFHGLADSLVCPTCTVLTVRNGWITDIATTGNTVTGLAISSGILSARNRAGVDVPLAVPNSYSEMDGERLRRLLGRSFDATRRVRALVLRGTELVAAVQSREELAFGARRTPMIYLESQGRSAVPSVVVAGDSVTVHGYGFLAGTAARGVSIVAGADTAAAGVEVRADGTFSRRIRALSGPGPFVVSAVQRDGNRLTVESGSITLVADEEEQ